MEEQKKKMLDDFQFQPVRMTKDKAKSGEFYVCDTMKIYSTFADHASYFGPELSHCVLSEALRHNFSGTTMYVMYCT